MLKIVLFALAIMLSCPVYAYGDLAKPKTGVCISPKDMDAGLMYMGFVRKIIAVNENNLFISYYANDVGWFVGVVQDETRACIFTQGEAIYVNGGHGI